MFSSIIEDMFSNDTVPNEEIADFFRETEFADCNNDGEKWRILFKKCEEWEKEYLLWHKDIDIFGLECYFSYIHICKFAVPKNTDDLKEYIYRMSSLFVVNKMDKGKKRRLIDSGEKYDNFNLISRDFIVEEDGYIYSTFGEQGIKDIEEYFQESKKYKYNTKFFLNEGANEAVRKDYFRCEEMLKDLKKSTKRCEVVRVNDVYKNENIWYFAKDNNYLYILNMENVT